MGLGKPESSVPLDFLSASPLRSGIMFGELYCVRYIPSRV